MESSTSALYNDCPPVRCCLVSSVIDDFTVYLSNSTYSQGKLEKKLKQIPYQNIFVPRSCIRSGLATQNLFTLDIHRRILRRVKSKMADYLEEIA